MGKRKVLVKVAAGDAEKVAAEGAAMVAAGDAEKCIAEGGVKEAEVAKDDDALVFEDGVSKNARILSAYISATGSGVRMFDGDMNPIGNTGMDGGMDVEKFVCPHCSVGSDGGCRRMHADAIGEASRQGKPRIYRCALGFAFWVSPLYGDGRFSGALRGSGFRDPEVTKFASFCDGGIPGREFSVRVSAYPVGDDAKIESLTEMLMLCAESLSIGSGSVREELEARHEQQSAIVALVGRLKEMHPDGTALLNYPVAKERALVEALRHGEKETAEGLLNEVLAVLLFNNGDQFQYIQLRALELAVLLVRAGTHFNSASAVDSDARYLWRVQAARSVEDLTAILHEIIEDVSAQIVAFKGLPHASAMRKAEMFIRENLTRKISLGEISRVVGFSAPYFSTIFKEEMGENLSSYVNRQRVEKAIKLLLETDTTLCEIAAACCFQDQSWFSKIFKFYTGVSPGKYRRQGGLVSVVRSSVNE